ncbi:CYTH-like domain-containing protein [Podospora fimiseda]|uniref:mRNA-capping enzyme subunit beta n=1 Tax=Podospora fimiseda TaxID=252190 RepID=A0AAN7GUY6_9PEZI|nr:CYTH-like domain-containing protein [Podospora fimiseda]
MDLRGILNDNGPPPASRPSLPPQPPTPQLQQHQQHQQAVHQRPQPPLLPSTPIQTNPQQSFRDYPQGPSQHSPTRHVSQDYGGGPRPSVAFASPTQYQQAGPYASRPAPPPLQPMPPAELRSPSVSSGPVPPSPYQQTPTSSISTPGGYPFPQQHPQHQTPTSPVSRQQYPPPSAYPRDVYGQSPVVAGMTGPPGSAPYMQSSHVPQTPPIGTPGGAPAYIQRSQSTHSTPTPTSAHSQPVNYGAPFGHGSPVATPHPPPQPSQPPTPGGVGPGPVSARPAQVVGYGPPSSPYQQRIPPGNFHPTSQKSPPPPPPPLLPRHSSVQNVYDPPTQDPPRVPLPPQSDGRGRSLSVSPKTRVPSLPSSSGRPGSLVSDLNYQQQHNQIPHPPPNMATILEMDVKSTQDHRASTPAKRKLDDRELRPDEMEKRDTRPPPFRDTNGRPQYSDAAPPAASRPNVPTRKEIKKRRVYSNPPLWAQTIQDLQGRPLKHGNTTLYRHILTSATQINGRTDPQASRHASPEEKRSIAPREAPASQPLHAAPPDPFAVNYLNGPLGHWEPSITNSIPPDSIAKTVADFLFHKVVLNSNHEDMMSRNVKFEIEAKLGTILENPSKTRIRLPVESECVLSEGFGFRSSMTEAQHRSFNTWLNQLVHDTFPEHPNNKRPGQTPRVPVEYQHRREVDKFVEIPNEIRDRYIPECILNLSNNKMPKIRITHDQKTDKILARIIKARVADASLHLPKLPFDCRISVNLEWEWDGPVEELDRIVAAAASRAPLHQRNKDRLSYRHCFYQVDLTQVGSPGNNIKEHELEVEIDAAAVVDQGRRAQSGQPHLYLELVSGLVNNIRVLAQKATEFRP